jgi:hypothetical protein
VAVDGREVHLKETLIHTTKPKPETTITQFLSTCGEIIAEFDSSRCICIACRSTELSYHEYLDDAKCSDCYQWQNEDLLPH